MKIINKILYDEVKLRWRQFIGVLVLVLIGVSFGALIPLPFKVIIDNVLGREALDKSTIVGRSLSLLTSREVLGFFMVLVYFISNMFSSVADYFASISTKKVSRGIVRSFALKAFENLEWLKIAYYKHQDVGDYLYRLSYDVSAFGNMMEDGFLPFLTNLLYLIVTIGILLAIDHRLALLALIIVPLLAFGLEIFNRKTDMAVNRSERSNSLLFSFIEEGLKQLQIIQAFNQQKRQAQIFDQKEDTALNDELRVYGLGFMLNAMIGIVVAIGYSLVLVFGMKSVFSGEISTGLLIVFIFYLDNLTNPLISLMSAITTLREQYIKVSRMGEFFNPKLHALDAGKINNITDPTITFDKVSVVGDENQAPILRNVSFKMPAGKKTVIVGVSGSGKTTIASLILRFQEPDHGRILIGDKEIQEYSLKSLRDNIAYVPQEIFLFNDTILNNILFGQPEAEQEAVRKSVKSAIAEEFIQQTPEGYHYAVGEGGANLSGGQRQRILIARALLKNQSKILIMDEPISSLDIKTRDAFLKNLNDFTKDKTTIIISNILEIIHHADYVIAVNEGQVIHAGSSASFREQSNLAYLLLHAR